MHKETIVDLNALDGYLRKIDAVFPIRNIVDQEVGSDDIVNYYRQSKTVYKYLHSYHGAVHLALNYDGKFDKKGYCTSLNEIFDLINASKVNHVLELGSGKGFNSIYLAKKLPGINFSGIDITDEHLAVARQKSHCIENLKFDYGDFHKLNFKDASFDLIFELESICHARDSYQVLSEAFRILKKGGYFVLYDGFRQAGFESLPGNLVQAAKLAEKSLAVNRIDGINAWLETAGRAGFKLKAKTDLSQAIMPNLARLQMPARKYFEYPLLAKFYLKIFSLYTMLNCIAVLLMPFTVHNKAHGYYKIILEK